MNLLMGRQKNRFYFLETKKKKRRSVSFIGGKRRVFNFDESDTTTTIKDETDGILSSYHLQKKKLSSNVIKRKITCDPTN